MTFLYFVLYNIFRYFTLPSGKHKEIDMQRAIDFARNVLWPASYLALFLVAGCYLFIAFLAMAHSLSIGSVMNFPWPPPLPIFWIYAGFFVFWVLIGSTLHSSDGRRLTLKAFLEVPGPWG